MLDRHPIVVWLLFAVVITTFDLDSPTLAQSPDAQKVLVDAPSPPPGFPKLTYRRWSGKINVPDPVAISVSHRGDIYVTQTQRRKIQDLDIRSNRDWVADDVGFASVDDKRDFYHRKLAIGGDQQDQSTHVEDVNQDGQYDYRDLTVISERIHKLTDTNGDGTADEITLFADGFQTEVTGIAAGVLHHDGSVWATIAPDVWKLTDTNQDGRADDREIMATGFGLHIAYAGHDMHGLSVGPDGKIYWSIGDKGISVTKGDGTKVSFPNQGGVMRCNPDGSDFEVFAHGLRNVQEPAFDQYGNLFGVDNDADQTNEKERFVWIVDQMDAGWRCNYQYRGDDYNPWTDEKLWEVAGEDHPAYIIPPIQPYYDGPAGFKFNPGTALGTAYRNFFFLTGAPNGNQYAFQTSPLGDSFEMRDSHLIGSGDPIVGIAFGPDGGLFGVDWGGGYPLNQTGSVIRIDVAEDQLSDDARRDRQSTKHWLQTSLSNVDDQMLVKLLGHADQRVRLRAQFKLADRNQSISLKRALNDTSNSELTRLHAVWGLGQLVRSGHADVTTLDPGLSDPSWRVIAQTIKTIGESGNGEAEKIIPFLNHPHAHIKVHAALALGRIPSPKAVEPLINLASSLKSDEHYLRHAIVTGLAACASPQQLKAFAREDAVMSRICGVLSLRRLSHQHVADYLNDSSDWVATEASRAIHDDLSIDAAMDALAKTIEGNTVRPKAMMVRAINANFRLGTSEHANRVARFALDDSNEISLRIFACQSLGDWNDPPRLDKVDGRNRPSAENRKIDLNQAAHVFSTLAQASNTDLRVAAVKSARRLQVRLERSALIAISKEHRAPDQLRVETLRSLSNDDDVSISVWNQLVGDKSTSVAVAALTQLINAAPRDIFETLQQSLSSKRLKLQQTAVAGLAKLNTDQADLALIELSRQFVAGTLPDGLRLDVWNAAVSRSEDTDVLKPLLNQIRESSQSEAGVTDQLLAFSFCSEGGDAKQGEQIFRTDLRAQCVRCHRTGKKGSNIGPELTRIAKQRDQAHLLRAIVYPSADIEPKYNTQSILLFDGSVVQGVIQREDDDITVVMLQDGKTRDIPTDDIEQIANKKVSLMPDMTAVLNPREVRDLVAFLKTLK